MQGIKNKIKVKKKIKSELKNFSISKYKDRDLKIKNNNLDSKTFTDENLKNTNVIKLHDGRMDRKYIYIYI